MFRKSKRLTMSENKHDKRHEIEHMDDMIDCISNLPDCILHHILSFLPTVKVVQTSILSKRWKNLWASVPSLDFDDFIIYASEPQMGFERSPEYTASFVNFEERILRSRDTPKIEKFHLLCHDIINPSRVSSWISYAVMHNVREVDLCLFANDPSAISPSVFDCKSLVILKIDMSADIQIPSRIYLPSLKILIISLVAFMNAELTEMLFSSCVVLEELVLWDCAYGMENITISSLTLKKLTIRDHMDDFRTHPSGCMIKIDAKNLTCFEYDGYLSNDFILSNVPSLVKACIHISLADGIQNLLGYRAVDLHKGLQNVVFLSVSEFTLQYLICANRFPNLTNLVLTTQIGTYTFERFMNLLNCCPILQSISLSKGFNSLMCGEIYPIWLSVPICISYHLKSFSFKNFHAYDSEIWFLKFVLKHARVLEKMNVRWCKLELGDLKKQRDVRKELKTTEKNSAACVCWN